MAALFAAFAYAECRLMAGRELERQLSVDHSGHWGDTIRVNRSTGTDLQNSPIPRPIRSWLAGWLLDMWTVGEHA